jgi:hypothetical protein
VQLCSPGNAKQKSLEISDEILKRVFVHKAFTTQVDKAFFVPTVTDSWERQNPIFQ